MKKSKAPIFVLAILSVVFMAVGVAAYFMIPTLANDCTKTGWDLLTNLGGIGGALETAFTFGNMDFMPKYVFMAVIVDVIIIAALVLLIVFWIINLVLLIVKKKPIHLIPNLAWLLASGFTVILLALALVPLKEGGAFKGALFEGSISIKGEMHYFHDVFGCLGDTLFKSEWDKGVGLCALVFILALIAAYILGLVAIIKSTKALSKEKKKKAAAADEENADEYEEDEEECECEEEDDKHSEKAGPYIIQNFYNGAPMPYHYPECHCHEQKPEPKPEPEPEPCQCECEEDRPLTAKELRAIIREELDDREHPEELEPLTDERAREVIQEELAEYYTGKDEEPEPEAEESSEDVMTADDLRKMIKEEVEGAVKPAEAGLTSQEVREIIREELGAAPKAEEPKEELSAEEVRSIVAEELAKYLQNIAVVEEVEPQPEPEPEPAPEPEPEPQPEPEPEPAPEPAAPVVRLSFAEKMTAATQDMKDNYNDLKAYALGYGLKSRVANGGDTFRLHTKTYFRINMVGKGLKLYFALDPKDYADSPIPVQDVGHKNLYKDIPLCFKVRSGLSVKRAKQLIDDVCGKAGLTAGAPVDNRDYAADLVNYVSDGSADGDDDED